MGFWCWFWEERNANFFTLFTVVLSGIISWIISAAYYKKGNRTNLKMSVIHPIIELLGKTRSLDNYKELCIVTKEYAVRYMNRREQKALTRLTDAYKEVARYDEDSVNADILLSYFEETVRSYSVDFAPVPVTINGEIVDYDPPVGYFEIQDNIYRIIKQYNPNYQHDDCQGEIEKYFVWFCNTYYPGTKIAFFKTCTLDAVLRGGDIREKWKKKFHTFKMAKDEFLDLPIARSTCPPKDEDKHSEKIDVDSSEKSNSLTKFAYAALYQMLFTTALLLLSRVYFAIEGTEVFSIPYAPEITTVVLGSFALWLYKFIDWLSIKIAFCFTRVSPRDSDVLTRGETAVIAMLTCIMVMGACAVYSKAFPDLRAFSLFLAALVIVIFQQASPKDCTVKSKWKRFWIYTRGIWSYIAFLIGSILIFALISKGQNIFQFIWTALCVLFTIFDCTRQPKSKREKKLKTKQKE